MKRKLLMSGLAMLAGLSLGACAGGGGGSSGTTALETNQTEPNQAASVAETSSVTGDGELEGTYEIEFFHCKPEDFELYETLIAKFHESYPNIKVTQTCPSEPNKAFVTRVASNDMPDLAGVTVLSSQIVEMMDEGIFIPLDDQVFLSRANDASVAQLYREDGHIYAMPITINGFGVYYNLDYFEQVGADVPVTLDEFINVCEKLKTAGIQPIVFCDKDPTKLPQQVDRLYIGSADHSPWDKYDKILSGEYSMIDDKALRATAEAYLKIREYGQSDTLATSGDQAISDFAMGNAAMMIDGTWSANAYAKQNPDLNYSCFIFPAITDVEACNAGAYDTGYVVPEGTGNEAAALKFIDFLTGEDIAQEFCDGDMNLNVLKSVNYGVEVLKQINDATFTLSGSTEWSSAFRSDQAVLFQKLFMDKDVDSFLREYDALVINYYSE